jgi:GntR family transcriptional regulator
VIGFRLDARSNVVPYETGDQLPTVRDVARELAINPNTVLKAYRELELEGLVDGRPGQGTFVLRSLAGPSLANQAGLRRELLGWLRRARRAGLDGDDIVALIQTTVRDLADEGVA